MNWRNVRLIYAREIRDQLRDRRTLFMIAVLPLLLYPLLGMSVFQLSQFLRTTEPKVLVVGSEQLKGADNLPALFSDGHFAEGLFDDPATAKRVNLTFVNGDTDASTTPQSAVATAEPRVTDQKPSHADNEAATLAPGSPMAAAQQALKSGEVQVVLNFPPDFGKRLRDLHDQLQGIVRGQQSSSDKEASATPPVSTDIPQPEILFNAAREKSRFAHAQILQVLNTWKTQIVRDNLLASRVPPTVARPFELKSQDVAERGQQQALAWSKILPFVLFIWALTGAFYPAVDLCAGEKERGTLETLLSSPALRTEIVWAKLLTVMTFSMATALLNLTSLGFTAQYIIGQLRVLPSADIAEGLDLPPFGAALWLVVALIPMSALFSALCLACAAFARSTKEGQYYLMPLLLITMPLMMLPMAPGAELDLGNSLIPVAGVVLLLKSLVQGNYSEAIRFVLPVCLVTLICCRLAFRWAVYQFNQESVLFRESERFDLRRWVVHLVRDRQDTPTLAEAFFCVAIIYVIQFFVGLAMSANAPESPTFGYMALLLFISQIVCIALPALMMTVVLTGRPLKTLLLDHVPRLSTCLAAIFLALAIHPLGLQVVNWIFRLYPVQEQVAGSLNQLSKMTETAPYWWLPYLLIALLPAICEEIAFRGFILSGLRHLGNKWWAIGLSAVFFGLTHQVIQQSLSAVLLGIVIGYIAVQTGSLIPGILFHGVYNATMFTMVNLPAFAEKYPALRSLYVQPEAGGSFTYAWPILTLTAFLSLGILTWFHRLPFLATKEEALSDARAMQSHHPLVSGAGNSE